MQRHFSSAEYDRKRLELLGLQKRIKAYTGDKRSKEFRFLRDKFQLARGKLWELHNKEPKLIRVDFRITFQTLNQLTNNIHTFKLTRSDVIPNTEAALRDLKRNALTMIEDDLIRYEAQSPYETTASHIRDLIVAYRADPNDPRFQKELPIFHGPNNDRFLKYTAVASPLHGDTPIGAVMNPNRTPKPRWRPAPIPDFFETIVNEENAPNIVGFESLPSGVYGCATELIFEACCGFKTREEIFDSFTKKFEEVDPFDQLPREPSEFDSTTELDLDLPIQLGLKVREIKEYLDNNCPWSKVYFAFPFQSVESSDHPDHKNRNYKALYYLIANNHIYRHDGPIRFNELKPIQVKEPIALKPEHFGMECLPTIVDQIKRAEPAHYWVDLRTAYDCSDFDDFITHMATQYKLLPQINVVGTDIVQVSYGAVRLTMANNLDVRHRLFNEIVQKFNIRDLKFNNQSFAQMVVMLYENKVCSLQLTESIDSPTDREIYNDYKTHACIGRYSDLTPTHSIDLRRCYLNILRDMATLRPEISIFNADDCFEKFDQSEPIVGRFEYLVDSFSVFGIVLDAQVWSGYALLEILKVQDVRTRITLVRKSTRFYRTDALVGFVRYLEREFPSYIKYLYTTLVGIFGKHANISSEGLITTDQSLFEKRLQQDYHGYALSTKLFFLAKETNLERPNSNGPLYRYVIGMGVVRLLRLASLLRSFDCQIVAVRVDAVSVVKPNGFTPEQTEEIQKTAQFEQKILKLVYKKEFVSRQIAEEDLDRWSAWLNPFTGSGAQDTVGDSNAIVNAIGGSGKSTKMNAILTAAISQKQSVLCISATNIIREKMRTEVKGARCFTFAKLEALLKNSWYRQPPKWVRSIDVIAIDEHSMMNSDACNVLACMLFLCGNKARRLAFGDDKQIPPVNAVSFDPYSAFSRAMFENLVVLPYNPEFGRYDADLYRRVKHFLETGTLAAFRDRMVPVRDSLDNDDKLNVVFTNETRVKVGNHKQSRGIVNNEVIVVNTNKARGYTNGDRMLQEQAAARKIPQAHYHSMIALTCDRAQGATFREPYTIYEAIRMSFQRIYVAITRATCAAHITIATDKPDELASHVFRMELTTREQLIKDPQYFDLSEHIERSGIVYLVRDDINKLVYVGRTEQELAERFAEECDPFQSHLDTPFDPKTATATELDRVPIGVLDYVETRYIAEYFEMVQDAFSDVYEYRLLNKYKLPKLKTEPRSEPRSEPATESDSTSESSELKPFQARLDERNIKIKIEENKAYWRVRVKRKNLQLDLTKRFKPGDDEEKQARFIEFKNELTDFIRKNLDAGF